MIKPLLSLVGAAAISTAATLSVGTPVASRSVDSQQADIYAETFVRSGTVTVRQTRSGSPFEQLISADTLSLALFTDLTITAEKEFSRETASGGIYWRGNLLSGEDGYIDLFYRNGRVTGSLYSSDHVYPISSEDDLSLQIVELDPSRSPRPECDHENDVDPLVTTQLPPAMSRATSTVDLLIVYPSAVENSAGGPQGIEDEIMFRIEEANQAFVNSNMNVQFRLVHHQKVSSVPSAASSASNVSTSEVTALRDQYGADLVSHWNSGGTAGSGNNFSGNPNSAYNTSNFSDVKSRYTFVHECGHNMGGKHDRYTYISQGRESELSNSYYKYGHMMDYGSNTARTIMSYDQCSLKGIGGSCTRVAHFSNPDVDYKGAPTGIAAPNQWAANNARRLGECAPEVAQFRQSSVVVESFTLTVNAGSGDGDYETGEIVTIAAVDSTAFGKEFNGWSGDTGYLADPSSPVTTVTMPGKDISITATYKEVAAQTFTLTVNAGSGDGEYETGEVVTITANDSSASGKEFNGWSGDTGYLADPSAAQTTVTMPGKTVSITATYKETAVETYTLSVTSGSGDGDYAENASVTITADDSTDVGRDFLHWSGAGTAISDSTTASATVTMPGKDLIVTAIYSEVAPLDTANLSENLVKPATWEAIADEYGSTASVDTTGDIISGTITTVADNETADEYSWAKVTAYLTPTTFDDVTLIKLTYSADKDIRISFEQPGLADEGANYAYTLPAATDTTVYVPVAKFAQEQWEGFPDSLKQDLDLSAVSAISVEGAAKGSSAFSISELKLTNFELPAVGITAGSVQEIRSLNLVASTRTSLKLAIPQQGEYAISVYSLSGRTLFSKSVYLTAGEQQLNTQLPCGVHLVSIAGNGVQKTVKTVVK